jgi:hypothetical protein
MTAIPTATSCSTSSLDRRRHLIPQRLCEGTFGIHEAGCYATEGRLASSFRLDHMNAYAACLQMQ